MNPEERLLVVQEHLSVKFYIILLGAFIRMFCPERMDVIDRNRTLVDLYFVLCRGYFYHFFLPVFIFLLFHLGFLMDPFYNNVILFQVSLIDRLIFLLRIGFGQENFHRHERAVLLQNFSYTILICKFQAVIIQEKSNFRSDSFFISV